MTTLKELIENKVLKHEEFVFEGQKWLRADFKSEVLPILLDMACAIEQMCEEGIDTSTDGGREFINQALERLRKWSEK